MPDCDGGSCEAEYRVGLEASIRTTITCGRRHTNTATFRPRRPIRRQPFHIQLNTDFQSTHDEPLPETVSSLHRFDNNRSDIVIDGLHASDSNLETPFNSQRPTGIRRSRRVSVIPYIYSHPSRLKQPLFCTVKNFSCWKRWAPDKRTSEILATGSGQLTYCIV